MPGTTVTKSLRYLPPLTGVLCLLLGATVLAAWALGSSWLQLRLGFDPMHPATALCLVLSGLGVLALSRQRSSAAIVLGGIVVALAAVLLVQSVLDVDLGADEPVVEQTDVIQASSPGRMAPNTAISFLLLGLGMLLMARAEGFSFDGTLAAAAGLALGGAGLLGHLGGVPYAYAWAEHTQMAYHTSVGLTAVGIGLLVHVLQRERTAFGVSWSPIVVGIVAALFGVLIWQALQSEENNQIRRTVEATARGVRGEVEEHLNSMAAGLQRLVEYEEEGEAVTAIGERWRETWVADTWLTLGAFESIESIDWIDSSLEVRAHAPRGSAPRPTRDDAASRTLLANAYVTARSTGKPAIVGPLWFEDGEAAFRILVPRPDGGQDPEVLSGLFSARATFEGLIERIAPGYSILVLNEGRAVYGHGIVPPERFSPLALELPVEVDGSLPWSVVVEPSPAVLRRARTALPEVVLGGSLVIAVLLTLTLRFGGLATHRARHLESAVQERTAELEEANAAKDRFLTTLGHELRNPLGSIRSALEVLARDPADAELDHEMREIIDRQVAHLSRRLDDLLDVSRIARGKLLIRPERIDLVQAVEETVEGQRGRIEARGLELATALPDEPLWVDADVTRIAQIVENLLGNAVKWSDAGGRITVSMERREPEVPGAGDTGGDGEPPRPRAMAAVTVRDTGRGLDPADLQRIFEPFAQSGEATPGEDGLGLGLSIVKGLVAAHEGTVEAASDGLGRGASFTFRIPLRGAPEALAAEPEPVAEERRPRRVLVIDDHRDSADGLGQLLSIHGHRVDVAYDAHAGLQEARRSRPDVVVCDIGLPGMDGYQVARRLREDDRTAGIVVIALSGYGDEGTVSRSLDAGFDRHLTKPVDPEDLLDAMSPGTP